MDALVRAALDPADYDLFLNGVMDDWGDAEEAVSRGSRFLDKIEPGWFRTVKINDLRMSSPCYCVLGQLFADKHIAADLENKPASPFSMACKELDLEQTSEVLVEGGRATAYTVEATLAEFLGFDAETEGVVSGFPALADAWRATITEKLNEYGE